MESSAQQEKRVALILDELQQRTAGVWSSGRVWWRCLAVLSAVAVVTRLTDLDQPPGTAWDEVHFGSFGNQYINRTFFHDVHPPLGKMLVASALRVTGYEGTFAFTVGTMYTPDLPYVMVRAMFGVLGAALVPLSFLTAWHLTESLAASVLAAVAVLTDHYLHRLCTLILLDGPLLLAILASVHCSFAFHNTKHSPGTLRWWALLSSTGVCLGTVMSIKYVGVFTVVFVGLHTAYQLGVIITDPQKPLWHVLPHTAARGLCLIVLPVALYLGTFVLHFAVLSQWNPNDGGFYHTRFTSSFNNTEYDNQFFPKHLDYGANVTIKNSLAMSGYLESWFDLFPSDLTAPCQQVTITTLRDEESLHWRVRFVNVSAGQVEDTTGGQRRTVRNGDHMVLTHQASGRSLRGHGHRAPLTKRHYQVCGYGDDGEAGPFETWQLLVPGVAEGVPLEAMNDDFMLKNFQMNCYLANPGNVALPNSWAYQSAKEVTCTKNGQAPGLLWHINWVNSTRMPLTRTSRQYSMSLWEKIVYQHQAMILGNSGLKPSEEDLTNSARPWMWPLMYRLQTLCAYNHDDIKDHKNQSVNSMSTSSNKEASSVSSSEKIVSSSNDKREVEDEDAEKESNSSSIYPNDAMIKSTPTEVLKKSNRTKKEIYAVFAHNPVLIYTNLLSFVLTLGLTMYHFYIIIRGTGEPEAVYAKRRRTVVACFWVGSCWGLHYLPFFCMSRILYTHHYCPAYCYSCMLTGIVVAHLCECLADWCSGKYRDLLLIMLLSIPSSLFLISYYLLFPLATHMDGRLAYPNPAIYPYMEKLHFGQLWVELGFDLDESYHPLTLVSNYEALNKTNLNNPDVNATLYYGTKLTGAAVLRPIIVPVPASNYSLWRSRATALRDLEHILHDGRQTLSDARQTLNDAEKTSDRGQTLHDGRQTLSDRGQTLSDARQTQAQGRNVDEVEEDKANLEKTLETNVDEHVIDEEVIIGIESRN